MSSSVSYWYRTTDSYEAWLIHYYKVIRVVAAAVDWHGIEPAEPPLVRVRVGSINDHPRFRGSVAGWTVEAMLFECVTPVLAEAIERAITGMREGSRLEVNRSDGEFLRTQLVAKAVLCHGIYIDSSRLGSDNQRSLEQELKMPVVLPQTESEYQMLSGSMRSDLPGAAAGVLRLFTRVLLEARKPPSSDDG